MPSWHGTLLPKTEADTWLAAAFADYERIYSLEKALKKRAGKKGLSEEDRDRIAVALYGYRSNYLAAARAAGDIPLAQTHSELERDEWYRLATGKGVLVLHELRCVSGDEVFEKTMDSFGRAHAGKSVTTAQFRSHVEKATGKNLNGFFLAWFQDRGLPGLRLGRVTAVPNGKGYKVEMDILWRGGGGTPNSIQVAVATAKGEVTKTVLLNLETTRYSLETANRPQRLTVDKECSKVLAAGGVFSTLSFHADPEQTLIVYGTADEVPANREAAEALQKAILRRGSNITVPIKADKDVTEKDLKANHLLLIGRPDSNRIVECVRAALPVTFGSRSFELRGKSYAHARSAVVAAGENPFNKRYSVVVAAGLSAEATLHAAPLFVQHEQPATEALLLAHGEGARALVVPARDLVRDVHVR